MHFKMFFLRDSFHQDVRREKKGRGCKTSLDRVHFPMAINSVKILACVAWRFCRARRSSGEATRKIKTAWPDSWPFQLLPPSTHFDILLTTCLVSVFPANQK